MLRADLPLGVKTTIAVWYFKYKIFPDGRIQNTKVEYAHMDECIHGGRDYYETYAPAGNCFSFRILMISSVLHDLETILIDSTLAFLQYNLDVEVFMVLLVGFYLGPDSSKYVIKLNKSLYGLNQAETKWFELLKSIL